LREDGMNTWTIAIGAVCIVIAGVLVDVYMLMRKRWLGIEPRHETRMHEFAGEGELAPSAKYAIWSYMFGINPFGRGDEHYTVSALAIAGRTIVFARITHHEEAWRLRDGEMPGDPTRIFFEVGKSGEIAIVCAFAPPLRLGEQL
jgi:hypothetical protein